MIHKHADGLPVSEDDDKFLDENNRLLLKHSVVQRMVYFDTLRYEENAVKLLIHMMNQDTVKILLRTSSREATNEILVLSPNL